MEILAPRTSELPGFEDRFFKEVIKSNEGLRVGPNPTGLASLQEEETGHTRGHQWPTCIEECPREEAARG